MNNWKRPNKIELDATKMPTEIDIAWAAGIFEGEGHCRLCGNTNRGFMASVVQKDTELLYRLRDWFGGSVNRQGRKNDIHVWDCCGDRGRLFIALIYKFMTARRKVQIDATRALDFLDGRSSDGLSVAQLKGELNLYYERGSLRKLRLARVRQNKVNANLLDDPQATDILLTRVTQYRKDMTPEERALYSEHQHQNYLRRKDKMQLESVTTLPN